MGWLLQENTSQAWKCASGQNQKAASRVGSLFPGGEVLGPSPEGWRLICLSLEEAATRCHVQRPLGGQLSQAGAPSMVSGLFLSITKILPVNFPVLHISGDSLFYYHVFKLQYETKEN